MMSHYMPAFSDRGICGTPADPVMDHASDPTCPECARLIEIEDMQHTASGRRTCTECGCVFETEAQASACCTMQGVPCIHTLRDVEDEDGYAAALLGDDISRK
jgi:hypothetical protein